MPSAPRRPTVIGKTPPKPTVIGNAGQKRSAPSKQAAPTVLRPVEHKSTLDKPTAIAGVISKHIEVSVDELSKRFPAESRQVLLRVNTILGSISLQQLTPVSCSQWGMEALNQYKKLTDESTALVTAGCVQDGSHYMKRLNEILQEIASALSDSQTFHLWGQPKNALEVYDASKREIGQLCKALDLILPGLRATQKAITEVSSKSLALIDELNAQCIAVQYVEELLGAGDDRIVQLESQHIVLLKTIANVQDGILLRKSVLSSIDQLADRIQEGILVTLPGWTDKLMLAFQSGQATETERYTLYEGIKKLIH